MSGDDDTEKEHEPTQKRLDDARKRGEVPRSADLTTAAVYGGVLLAVVIAGSGAIEKAGTTSIVLIEQSDRLARSILGSAKAPMGGILMDFALPFAPFLALPMLAALISLIGQQGLMLNPEKILPKWSRISPVSSFKQKFGRDGLFTFAKGMARLILICILLTELLISHEDDILLSLQMPPAQSTLLLLKLFTQFLELALLGTLFFGGLDYGWQVLQHRRRNRMSRQEVVEESRESDGDPHMKMHRRQRGRELALSQMLLDVQRADVIVVNPTHYAVALKWKRGDKSAPICLAKGADDIAARIRERAAEFGVPIHRDPPTARAIYATVDVGAPIRTDHFKAVAAAIRFAEAMRKRARNRTP